MEIEWTGTGNLIGIEMEIRIMGIYMGNLNGIRCHKNGMECNGIGIRMKMRMEWEWHGTGHEKEQNYGYCSQKSNTMCNRMPDYHEVQFSYSNKLFVLAVCQKIFCVQLIYNIINSLIFS